MAFKPVTVRCHGQYDPNAASDETALVCKDASLTVQSDLEDADINMLVDKFGLGFEPPRNVRMPMYGDFTGVSDFQTALHAVRDAEDSFMRLDPKVRARFENDPQKLLEFCGDANNKAEAISLGLVERPPADVVAAPAAAPAAAPVVKPPGG